LVPRFRAVIFADLGSLDKNSLGSCVLCLVITRTLNTEYTFFSFFNVGREQL
jgi:hypothetical protein